jgi:preprotein translocase subunit SecG
MYQFILFVHVLVAAFIILLVLIQQGKGATMGAAFGSGASQTVFGARGSGSFLFRLTMSCIGIFFLTSLVMNYIATSAYREAGQMEKSSIVNELPLPAKSVPVPVVAPEAVKPASPLAPEVSKTAAPVTDQSKTLTDQIPVKK